MTLDEFTDAQEQQKDLVMDLLHTLNQDVRSIVLEACATRRDLLNPTRFFGGALKMVPNMLRVANDIRGFLDMKKTETFYETEYHLRS